MIAAPPDRPPSRLTLAFLAAGLLAIATQVVLAKELVVGAAGDELALGVALAAWLGGIAIGAWVAKRAAALHGPALAVASLCALALAGGTIVAAGRLLRRALAPPPGELPGLLLAVVLALATLAPAGALVGATFTSLGASAARRRGVTDGISRLYVAESLGSLVGGALVTLCSSSVPPLPMALGAGLLTLLVTIPATGPAGLPGRRGIALAALALALALFGAGPFDRLTERLRFEGTAPGIPLVDSTDTAQKHVDLGGDEVLHLYESGQYTASFPDPYEAETLGHVLGSLAARPDRVLVLGGVSRGLARVLLLHPVEELTLLEPDERATAFLLRHLPAQERRALSDPRVRIVHDDPRRFFRRSREHFDLIVLLVPDPVTLRTSRLTTREAFANASARLSSGGVLVVTARTAPNVVTGETAALAGSLFGTLSTVFPVVRATPGPDSLLVAGRDAGAVTLRPDALAERFRARQIVSTSFSEQLFPLLLPEGRIATLERSLREASALMPPSTDDRPVSFLHALSRRQSETGSRAAGRAVAALGSVPRPALAFLCLVPSLAGLLREIVSRKKRSKAVSHAILATGASAMALSLVLLLSFQARCGALHGQLGLLTAAFMLGLSAGAETARRALSRRRLSLAFVCLLGAAVASLLAIGLPSAPALGSLSTPPLVAIYAAALFLCGSVTGALFPVAAASLEREGLSGSEAAGRLEALDHAGAAVSALVASVLLVPVLGTAGTAWIAAAVLGLAALRCRLSPE